MTVPNLFGVIVIEALKALRKPVTLADIISEVASFLECPQKKVEDLVTKTVNGGVRYGFIQQNKNKFACFPINLSVLTDVDNLYATRKKKAHNSLTKKITTADDHYARYKSPIELNNVQSVGRDTVRRSASTCTYIRSKHTGFEPSTQGASSPRGGSSKNKCTSSNSSKGVQKSESKPKSKWRI